MYLNYRKRLAVKSPSLGLGASLSLSLSLSLSIGVLAMNIVATEAASIASPDADANHNKRDPRLDLYIFLGIFIAGMASCLYCIAKELKGPIARCLRGLQTPEAPPRAVDTRDHKNNIEARIDELGRQLAKRLILQEVWQNQMALAETKLQSEEDALKKRGVLVGIKLRDLESQREQLEREKLMELSLSQHLQGLHNDIINDLEGEGDPDYSQIDEALNIAKRFLNGM